MSTVISAPITASTAIADSDLIAPLVGESIPAWDEEAGSNSARSGKERLVVVGNGMAGVRVVEDLLRANDPGRYDITIFGDEPHGNYNRILLSHVLTGEEHIDDIFLNAPEWYRQNGITLNAGSSVTSIDRWAKKVFTADGTATPYDKLLLATGSRPYFPPLEGLRTPSGELKAGVFGFRNIADCEAMLERAKSSKSAVVVGGGLLGLEAARGMLARGLQVEVVHASPDLMNQQLDTEAAAILRSTIETLGIVVHVSRRSVAVLGEDSASGIAFEDGTSIDADMIIFATGTRPNVEVAVAAGLTVQRAIVVDDHMRSIDSPDIYAVGECAEHRGEVYGLVAPLWEQASTAAAHLQAEHSSSVYMGSKVATKLKVMGIELATMGLKAPTQSDDEVVRFVEPKRGVYKNVIVRDGKLIGATLLGDVNRVAFLLHAYDRGTPLPEQRHTLLFDIGVSDTQVDLAQLSGDAQICNCNGVDKDAITSAVNGGARNLSAVMSATRAGNGCGSCKSLVGEIVEWACGGSSDTDPQAGYYVPAIALGKAELTSEIRNGNLKSVSSVFNKLGVISGEAASKPGIASLLRTVWGAQYEDERDARFINDRVHANIQKDGTFSVVPRIPGGVTSADQLRRIAAVVEKFQIPMVKVTGAQRIDLLGVKKDDLPLVWQELDMESGFAYSKTFRTVKTCVGSEYCRFGLGNSTELGVRIDNRFKGMESPAKMKLAVSGCPRNCAESLVKDVGVVAIEGGLWEIYAGGTAGSHVRRGDLLAVAESMDQVMLYTGRFIQYYRENAKYLERPYAFVERVGIEQLRLKLIEGSSDELQRLDDETNAAVQAYEDPWLEARSPRTANQFRKVMPIQ